MAQENEEHIIEISIEALTGTVYDLCVSPYETILGIKLKVQRLEGIPVYQQQLVWNEVELQDEYCLEEYAIPSGAQLKLMVAMRGGPIHAQRVHLDLEEPTFLEIAELLDTQGGDKYALMLLRSGDDVDHASILQVHMLEEDSVDAIRLSPIQMAESGHKLSVSASKTAQAEHSVTKDKMKTLMTKLKKVKDLRNPAPSFAQLSSTKFSRKATTGNILILDRTPSHLLTGSRGVPLSLKHANEARHRVDRKLLFCGDVQSSPSGDASCSNSPKTKKRITSCSRQPYNSEETPIVTRLSSSRLGGRSGQSESPSEFRMRSRSSVGDRCGLDLEGVASSDGVGNRNVRLREMYGGGGGGGGCGMEGKDWHRSSKRKRRTSQADPTTSSTTTTTTTTVTHLNQNLSHLNLNSSHHSPPLLPPINPKCTVARLQDTAHSFKTCPPGTDTMRKTSCHTTTTTSHRLPCLVTPTSLPSVTPTRTKGLPQHLPSLSIMATATSTTSSSSSSKHELNLSRKKKCLKCGKRMGLASTYSCRCGGVFCALHRYAESHSCTFDYKTEGRALLARTNPVVASQKLPKI